MNTQTEFSAGTLATLETDSLSLTETTRMVAELEESEPGLREISAGISGNVTLELFGTFLRKHALLHGQRARVQFGALDDHVGNARRFTESGVDAIIMVDLADALLPAFETRLALLPDSAVRAAVERLHQELAIAFNAARAVKRVYVSRLFRVSRIPPGRSTDRISDVMHQLNEGISALVREFSNVQLLHGDRLAEQIGLLRAVDFRSYQRFRAPFGGAFLDALARETYRVSRGFDSYYYKALIVDGDNTLWGGVLGEDLAAGISLGPFGHPGSIFWRVQHELLAMQRRGVLICLCSKNEPADIDTLFGTRKDMVLQPDDFAAMAVNWGSKPENLRILSDSLNIGLDSIIFLDDSPFECEAVRTQLPMVRTIQVPSDLSQYPTTISEIRDLLLPESVTDESSRKTDQYRQLKLATTSRALFATQEEYLASLDLKVSIHVNDPTSAPRIAELTQKSNQFNLTTRRYTPPEIDARIDSSQSDVYSIHVSDKFGDAGLTGAAIVDYSDSEAAVDTFLLSCRVLGRGVEYACWNTVAARAVDRGMSALTANYVATAKNNQVRDFWIRVGLELVSETEGARAYRVGLGSATFPEPPHIEVTCVV